MALHEEQDPRPTLRAKVAHEPLRSAYGLEALSFRSVEEPRAFPETNRALEIEELSRFHRLDAAHHADIFLFQCTQQFKKRPDQPTLADRLVSALGVWAVTRARMEFDDEALLAMGHAISWVVEHPGSSTHAYTYQRSARIDAEIAERSKPIIASLLSRNIEHDLQVALKNHSLLVDGDGCIGSVHLDEGRILVRNGHSAEGRRLLRTALRRLRDPNLQFEAVCLIVSSYLQEDDLNRARLNAKRIDRTVLSPTQTYLHHQLQSRLHLADRPERALLHRLDALALAIQECGPECVLDDLEAVGRLRDLCEIDSATQERIVESIHALTSVVDSASWRNRIQRFRQRLLLGDPASEGCPLPCQLRKQLMAWQRAQLKPMGIEFEARGLDPEDPNGYDALLEETEEMDPEECPPLGSLALPFVH